MNYEDCTTACADAGVCDDALKKQVALPIVIDEYKRVKCPRGHNLPVMYREKQFPYCPFCGQKIDWRKQNGSKSKILR